MKALTVLAASIFLLACSSHEDTQETETPHIASTPAPEPVPAQVEPPPRRPPMYLQGQQFTIGYWTYTVNSVQVTTAIPGLGNYLQFADSAFLMVDIMARNDGNKMATMPEFSLLDLEARHYESSPKARLMTNYFGQQTSLDLVDLNPGVAKRGFKVFDIPLDTTKTYLLVASGGWASSERALVLLKCCKPEPAPEAPKQETPKQDSQE